jgi:hypothetical protein
MKYMLLICAEEDITLTEEQQAEMQKDTEAWVADTEARGVRLAGSRLRPVSDASTVRVRDAQVLIVDGPFAETKEQIAGFDIIECANLDEAVEVAAKHPISRNGAIEVRPFWP